MRHTLIGTILIVLLASTAFAQWIMPLDCDQLFSDSFEHSNVFMEPANVCFYGSGHSGTVQVTLENEDNTYDLNVPAQNNVITSLSGHAFSEVACGDYTLSADDVTHLDTIVVLCEGDDYPQDDIPPRGDVPEFGTLAAAAALLGTGVYIHRRRRSL